MGVIQRHQMSSSPQKKPPIFRPGAYLSKRDGSGSPIVYGFFDYESAEVVQEGDEIISGAAKFIKDALVEGTVKVVEIQGYTDISTSQNGSSISKRRAQVVAAKLQDCGVPVDIMVITDKFAEDHPHDTKAATLRKPQDRYVRILVRPILPTKIK
jgi:outer membrane protein OmpA-like peptidoglycan-associated protein